MVFEIQSVDLHFFENVVVHQLLQSVDRLFRASNSSVADHLSTPRQHLPRTAVVLHCCDNDEPCKKFIGSPLTLGGLLKRRLLRIRTTHVTSKCSSITSRGTRNYIILLVTMCAQSVRFFIHAIIMSVISTHQCMLLHKTHIYYCKSFSWSSRTCNLLFPLSTKLRRGCNRCASTRL